MNCQLTLLRGCDIPKEDMRVAVIKQHGPPETITLEDFPTPQPQEGEFLIRVKACGINHLDTWVRRGVPGHNFPLPLIPGSDITGVIEKIHPSSKTNFHLGDRVIINPSVSCGKCYSCESGKDHICSEWGLLGETANGGCAELITVSERQVYQLPASLTFEQGACIPINYVTAWEMLVGKAKIRPGESIVIHGAGSGVSIACIQIAKMFGMQIYVTSNSDEKLHKTKMVGAHRFINTSKEPFVEAIRRHTSKVGVDVVVDHVGSPTLMDSIKILKRGGRLVSCGATAGSKVEIDWKYVFFKNITLFGSTYGTRTEFVDVIKAFESGRLHPIIDTTIKLKDISSAHRAIEERRVFGKIVVVFN